MSKKASRRRLEPREDGHEHATEIVANSVCAYCRNVIPIRAEGRPRKYCDSTCRAAAYRESQSTLRNPSSSRKGGPK